MHDDRTIVEARLNRVLNERIRPVTRPASVPLTVEAWDVPGEPVPVGDALAAEYRPFAIGSPWGRPWGTTWFRMTGTVPAGWAGRRVEATLNLGFGASPGFQAEGLLWVPAAGGVLPGPVGPGPSGREHGSAGRVEGHGWVPWRGLHPLNHDVLVADPAAGGEAVSFLVEAAANPEVIAHRPSPNSDVLTAGDQPVYALSAAKLSVVDTDVWALREDIRTLVELMNQLPLDQPRRHEVLRALERMLDVLVLDDVAGTAAAARAELAEVLSRPAVPSAHRLSAIGHAHIDSAWLWPIRETHRKCGRTFSNVLRLMEDYPELKFACSQAAQYEWILEDYPSVFDAIAKRVADGRWIPVGGMWVEPDVNLAGGEALVRQLTFGQRFFQQHFGVRCDEVWIPDVFGYSGALPQIMRLGGCDRFLTQKLSWNKTNKFPHHSFWWEGIDGSTVFTHFPPIDSYGSLVSQGELGHAVRNFTDKGRATRSMLPFGFGDGGGGPNRQMLEQYRRGRDLEGSPRMEIESPSAFFTQAVAEYGDDAPRWVGELYFETHRGTYTSQARTKAGNRRCELLLREAELWCVAAYGGRSADGYPKDVLDRIWKTVLLHQFHDILPGSSIAWVHREAEATYAGLTDQLEGIIETALERLTGGTVSGTGGADGGGAWLVNGAPHARDEVVLVPADAADAFVGDGVQVLADGRVAARVAVPALGLAPAVALPPDRSVTASDRMLDNGLLCVALDDDGLLQSVLDRRTQREVMARGGRGNLLQIHPDFPTEYDAWDLDDFYRRQCTDLTDVDAIDVLDTGPLIGRIRVTRGFRSSTVRQVYELRAGSPRLDVITEIDWHERDHVLKAAFPVDIHTDEVTREIQFGHLRSAIHTNTSWDAARFEVCAHRWIDVSESGYGVALLNDAKYGHDITRTRADGDVPSTTMRLTLLKGAQYPDPHADEGSHHFTYALLPHAGDLRADGVLAEVVAEGYRLNLPVRLVPGASGASGAPGGPPGGEPPAPVVRSDNPAVVIEAVKPADDDSGDLVVRLYEAAGGRARARLDLGRQAGSVASTNLLEEADPALPEVPVALAPDGRAVEVDLRPFQIATLRLGQGGPVGPAGPAGP